MAFLFVISSFFKYFFRLRNVGVKRVTLFELADFKLEKAGKTDHTIGKQKAKSIVTDACLNQLLRFFFQTPFYKAY